MPRNPNYPFYENYSEQQLYEWAMSDPVGFQEYAQEKWREYEEQKASFPANHPLPCAFEGGEDDLGYKSAMQAFNSAQIGASLERAMENVRARHTPPPSVNPNVLGMASRDPHDRLIARQNLEDEQFIEQERIKMDEAEFAGNWEAYKDSKQRMSMTQRMMNKRTREHPFQYRREEHKLALQGMDEQIRRFMGMSPQELAQHQDFIRLYLAKYNANSDAEHTYILNGPSSRNPERDPSLRIVKVDHQGTHSSVVNQMASSSNLSELDWLLERGFGKEIAQEKPEEAEGEEMDNLEAAGVHPLDSLPQAEFEAQRELDGAPKF